MRETASAMPPAGNGTIARIGRSGQPCASATSVVHPETAVSHPAIVRMMIARMAASAERTLKLDIHRILGKREAAGR